MERKTLFEIKALYRDDFRITGFSFGKGEKAACIVGSMRGNENQQLYACSQLIRKLKELEEQGCIKEGKEILVVPCVNPYSMNIKKRFWPIDNTDINRMYPGYNEGETTQRIAAGIFEKIQEYEYGVQLASNYMPGEFMPYINVMTTGLEDVELAKKFGLPYVVIRNSRPYDTTTLNYNWQIWESNAFSLYTRDTDRIDEASAQQAVSAVLRYLSRVGVVKYNCHSGYMSTVINESTLAPVLTPTGGIFRPKKVPGDPVEYGEVIGEILDPLTAELSAPVTATTSGVVFFATDKPLVLEHEVAFKLIRRLHV